MSTPNNPPAVPTFQTIQTHLLEIDPTLRSRTRRPIALPEALLALEKLNATLKKANLDLLSQSRTLYQDLAQANLTTDQGKRRLAQQVANLNKQLQALDETSTIDGQGRKSFMTFTAGSTATEQEARLNVDDDLLAPSDLRMIEDCTLGPTLRPGMYALTFTYQEQTVEFAGAFVLTRQSTPMVSDLTSTLDTGPVLFFTPSRGLEAFPSLPDLEQSLWAALKSPAGHAEITRHLPVRYQALDTLGIWPLQLQPIESEPLFEHTWNAILDKRRQDIDLALSLTHNPTHDTAILMMALDKALSDALPDLTQRLDFRAQRLLELGLYNSLPDWYRNAAPAQQSALVQQIRAYNQARGVFVDLFGAAATPQSLAHFSLIEQLADELDIHDLDPSQLLVTTRRTVPNVGTYEQRQSLVELSLRGLHTGDELPGSTFEKQTRLTYAGAALTTAHTGLTPVGVRMLVQNLQPRLDFAKLQIAMKAKPEIRSAARTMLDQRLVTLAQISKLQGSLSPADHQLFEQLRETPQPHLHAHTVSLHDAQLKDLWMLRENDAQGEAKRILLCTPESPRAQSFITFANVRECQAHILAWAVDKSPVKGRSMHDYLMSQAPLRFQPKMELFLTSLTFKPDAGEHLEVTFGTPCNYTQCLDAMVGHLLDGQLVDDYEHGTPSWYRSASSADRTRMTTLSADAAGALDTYNARPDAEANFPSFEAFLHDKAKLSLNALLSRPQNDIDPDSIFAYSPKPLLGAASPPLSYTQLYRDGYEDGIGFLNEKFAASATFRGPPDVDLSHLTAQNVARSVTGIWIGRRYTDEVRKSLQFVDSPGYAARRDATLKITQLQMKSAALESRLQGDIASADLAWLERAIDSLPDTAVTSRNTYQVHRLSIEGDWVIGCYLFRHADNPVLLYTPNAPDGIGVREARLFNYLLKKDNGFLAYLTNRMPLQSQTRVNQWLLSAQKGLPEDINRTTPSPARHDSIAHAMPLTDLRHDLYNMNLQRKIDNVHATTVNRTQMITGILWTCVEWVTAIATIPFPALSLSLGGLLAFKDAMLALDAYHQGDKGGALQHYIGYLANLGGALLFDLRPAITGSFYALRPVRPTLTTGKEAVKAAQLKQLQASPPDTMKPVLVDGQSFWTPQAPDALGRHLLYRQDPVSGQMQSTARLVNQNAEGRWVRSGLAGGGRDSYQTLVEEIDNTLAIYEVSANQARTFRAVLDPDFKTRLEGDWGIVEARAATVNAYDELRPLHSAYSSQVERLANDVDTFYKTPPPLPTRATLPHITADARPADMFKILLGQNKRLIVGAPNASIASKQLLIENMQELANLGLKRLYIENLPADLFRNKLKIINREATGNLTAALQRVEDHLARVDLAMGYTREASFTFRNLMLQAHRHNIAIDGLDASSSYHMEHLLDLADGERFIPRSNRVRNFYSHKVIERNAQKNPGEGWIALVEQNRLGTYEQVPGLADLQSAYAVRIEDVAPGQPVGIWVDTQPVALSRGHYKLTLSTPYHARPKPGPAPVPSAAVSATHYSEFDMPQAMRKHTQQLADSHRGLDSRYSVTNEDPRKAAFDEFVRIRQRLQGRAEAFFADYTSPPRASLTQLAEATSERHFIERLYQQKLGLVIGESHSAQSSKQFLIQHMKLLKQQGVKTLYVEHLLTDLHQHELDILHDSLKMPSYLKAYLKQQDHGHMLNYQGPNTYTNVVKAANKYGIRVRALDCTASYHTKGARGATPRNTLFSYFATEVIKADQIAFGPHKWVAFMGSAHTDINLLVPGIAQLQDAVSLHVRDAAAGTTRALTRGGWVVDEFSTQALRSDFTLEIGIAGRPTIRPPAPPSRTRLHTKGFFLIERPSASETNLVHRSNSGEIVVTPIQIDDKGQFFIDRWEKIRNHRFMYQSQLIEALKFEIHLIPAP
ncbi:membrane-targeted effector domain-containing toxin [Pseudomonas costantinii]|uniref:membrane-targeted effector domain-containing toxin n=1 Tax=Pseudomonas costantinii TaxID=168469 RepID=UPI0015A2B6EE|nr:membrane-targeted effector domain-containing toxin [Pseudomonas costantinii]NVZ72411.1 membrane-targeted effector domain-containing toxin [Pseudomonas costantinii]